ncbi:MAG: HRDC domain-containing protein [Ignavibacteriales bacterium]|nr:HRDC domain-containing protein [Ignavibacteriales bacterium]
MNNNLRQNVIFTFDKSSSLISLLRKCDLPILIIIDNPVLASELERTLSKNKIKIINLTKRISLSEKIFVKKNLPQKTFDIIICDNFSMKLFTDYIKSIIFYQNYFSIDAYFSNLKALTTNVKNILFYIIINPIENITYYSKLNNIIDIKILTKVYNLIYDYQKVAIGSRSDKDIIVNIELFNFLSKHSVSEKLFMQALSMLENNNYIHTNLKKEVWAITLLCDDLSIADYIYDEAVKKLFLYLFNKTDSSAKIEINFIELQDEFLISKEKLTEQLKKLEEWGFIELPRIDELKKIRLLEARIHPRYLKIDFTFQKEKKENIAEGYKILNDYLFNNKCRNWFVEKYYCDENPKECMVGNNCKNKFDVKKIFTFLICSKIIEKICLSENSITKEEIFEYLWNDYLTKKFIEENKVIDLESILQQEINNSIDYLLAQNILLSFENKIYLIKREKEKTLKAKQETVEKEENSNALALFHKLIALRKSAARKYTQTEDLICSDKILIEITNMCPTTPSELFSIQGFTQRMFNKVGEEFLKATRDYKFNKVTDKSIPTELQRILELIEQGNNLKQISNLTNLSETFLSFQIEVLIRFKPDIDIMSLIKNEDFELIKNEYEKGSEDINAIYSALGNKINKNKIRIALAKLLSV